MQTAYINHTIHIAESRWALRNWQRQWYRIYADDHRYAPTHFGALRHLLRDPHTQHVQRARTIPIHLEALPRRLRTSRNDNDGLSGPIVLTPSMEEPVCATLVMADPRRTDATAYLALLHCINDEESLDRLLSAVMEELWPLGCRRVVGPVGISPYWGSGALCDYFHLPPPLHTAYNPPYLPDLLAASMRPWQQTRLFIAETPSTQQTGEPARARIAPLVGSEVASCLPWLINAGEDFHPTPDTAELNAIMTLAGAYPWTGWVAYVDDRPAGCLVLQADLSRQVARAKGGRNLFWRGWLHWRSRRPTTAGRILLLAVAPDNRGQGVGRQLWNHAVQQAILHGWTHLSIGPVSEGGTAAHFLTTMGAKPERRFTIFETEF